MSLNLGYIEAPPGFVYPSRKKQLADRKAGRSQRFKKPPLPSTFYYKSRFKVIIKYKWWIPPLKDAVQRALSNFNNGRSMFQTIVSRNWNEQTNYATNPNWMGMDYPPITFLIKSNNNGICRAYCTTADPIPKSELRRAIWREIESEAGTWQNPVISITIIEPTGRETRYALSRGLTSI